MATKTKVKSIPQVSPTRRLMIPKSYPVVDGDSQKVKAHRPARSISQLIKRGLVKGITKDITSTDGNSYDKAEGVCPQGLRLGVDKFELATTMLRNGDNAKTLTQELNK